MAGKSLPPRRDTNHSTRWIAAGLGNAVSDVMGIGLADRIERISGRFLAVFGIISPKLTSAQWRLPSVRKTQLMVRETSCG